MSEYMCTVCGYVYSQSVGDATNKVPAQTPFEDLPETWSCPVCGASKSLFDKQ